jgi:hypothetical protein
MEGDAMTNDTERDQQARYRESSHSSGVEPQVWHGGPEAVEPWGKVPREKMGERLINNSRPLYAQNDTANVTIPHAEYDALREVAEAAEKLLDLPWMFNIVEKHAEVQTANYDLTAALVRLKEVQHG